MPIVTVVFTRKESSGVDSSNVSVGNKKLNFNANGKAKRKMSTKKSYWVKWDFAGNPRSTLRVDHEYSGKSEITFKDKMPSNQSKENGARLLELD